MSDSNCEPTHPSAPDPAQQLAQDCAASMWARDHAAQALGMRLHAVGPGRASLGMVVRPDMVNGHRICHGGLIFTLADTAFAYACNSSNANTVASACQIDFLSPARLGDELEAQAQERALSGRSGVYDVTVRLRGGPTVALFRGKSHRIQGVVIEEPPQAA